LSIYFTFRICFLLGSPHRFATTRQCDNKETLMPVKIGTFGPLSEAEFTELRQQKARKTDPAMAALLAEIAIGQPVRVPLVEGQSARGLRTAISRAATSRGLSVETVEGDGFVAVKKTDEPRSRKGKQASSQDGQRRRGRPPKHREQDAAEIASLQDLAAGEG
jgi:hypothetical protein